MPYIKWNESRTVYIVWHGPSLSVAAMTAKGYERVDVLPDITPEEVPLEDLTFSKYKVVQKLMELGMWESIKAKLTDTQKDFLYLAQDFRIEDPNFYRHICPAPAEHPKHRCASAGMRIGVKNESKVCSKRGRCGFYTERRSRSRRNRPAG